MGKVKYQCDILRFCGICWKQFMTKMDYMQIIFK